ncbi:hypothetical protein [Absidia glauca]|uniref:Uncharacterized protein n=1 Tax=Absidia glauca TaxID=4829 RepID=A0A168QVT3_ABSGL|nr:hypothetical protein [Absidia glauca]
MKYSDTLSSDLYTIELACNRALLVLSALTFLLANATAIWFRNFLPSIFLVTASFSYFTYYVLTEVNYTIVHDEGVYLLVFYISSITEYLGRLVTWLCLIEVFRLNPRVKPLIWIFPYLMYLLGAGMFAVHSICYGVLGLVAMVMGRTTPVAVLDCMADARLVALYLFWPFVGAVFLLFCFYRKTVNHFYGTLVFFYLCLFPGILILTVDESILSKVEMGQIKTAYLAEFVLYRLIYLFAIAFASLFAAQWSKIKQSDCMENDELVPDVVDIDINEFEGGEKTRSPHHELGL